MERPGLAGRCRRHRRHPGRARRRPPDPRPGRHPPHPRRLQPDRLFPQPARAADELRVQRRLHQHLERDPRQQRDPPRVPDRLEPPAESVRRAGLHLAQPLRLGGPVRRRRHRRRVQRRRPTGLLHLHGHRPDLAARPGEGLPVGAREHRQRLSHADPPGWPGDHRPDRARHARRRYRTHCRRRRGRARRWGLLGSGA